MIDTVSKKFAYTVDTCIVSQSKHFEDVEDTLTSDLTQLENFSKHGDSNQTLLIR